VKKKFSSRAKLNRDHHISSGGSEVQKRGGQKRGAKKGEEKKGNPRSQLAKRGRSTKVVKGIRGKKELFPKPGGKKSKKRRVPKRETF